MRRWGLGVVVVGLAALALIAIDGTKSPETWSANQETASEQNFAIERLFGWAAFVGFVALTTLASGLGDLMMSRRAPNPQRPPRTPNPTNGETATMIDAEVNEGGPPSPIPCDTPFDSSAHEEVHHLMSEKPMTIETCPAPDRILHLPLGTMVRGGKSTTLMKSDGLELIRLVVPAGKEIPPHRAPSEITVQCIEGLVAFEHDGHSLELRPGDLLHLCPQETHALKGIADSSVLVTRLRPHANELPEKLPPR
jgi:quercetin dioxygenase-like cupin family protein